MTRATDILCVFRIQFAGTHREVGPFLLAAFLFPAAMYLFANAVAGGEVAPPQVVCVFSPARSCFRFH